MSLVKTICRPSGDQLGPKVCRVKNKSSIGMARADGFSADVTDLGSVTVRSSGPEAASSGTADARTAIVNKVRRMNIEPPRAQQIRASYRHCRLRPCQDRRLAACVCCARLLYAATAAAVPD